MKITQLIRLSLILLFVILLSGCLGPQSFSSQHQPANEEQLLQIQSAVDKFQETTNGLLPIKTKDNDTPVFEKYLLDFDRLKEENIIADLPSNAYEKGGIYQYIIINPEDNPEVKVIDLRMTDELQNVFTKIDIYRSKHIYPPYGNKIEDKVFEIDYEKIGYKEAPSVISPYSGENLPILMDIEGQIFVDYRIDLYRELEAQDHDYEFTDDLRYLLTDHYPFAPAFSMPYTLDGDEPIIITE